MTRSIKFNSIYGYSTTSAKPGERLAVAFRVNCKDNFPEEGKCNMAANVLDEIIYPEVMKLIKEGRLPLNFRLWKVHLLMFGDEFRNEILLNDDVRFLGNVLFENDKAFEEGEPVSQGDIKDILGLYPSTKCDPNAGHVMLVKVKGKWYYAAELIYDKDRVKKRFETSKSFLKVSNYCLENSLWGPFVDNVFSATELSIQSILLLQHHPTFSVNQGHDETITLFSAYARNGNIETKFSDHYQKLIELRKNGRYLTGLHGHSFSLDENRARDLIALTSELIQYVEKLLTSINLSQNPPGGHYIAFGNTDF
jgi:hypothetical protein